VLQARTPHLDFITPIIFGKDYKLWSSPLCNFLRPPVTSSLLDPNIVSSTVFSNTFLRLRDQVSHPFCSCLMLNPLCSQIRAEQEGASDLLRVRETFDRELARAFWPYRRLGCFWQHCDHDDIGTHVWPCAALRPPDQVSYWSWCVKLNIWYSGLYNGCHTNYVPIFRSRRIEDK
jgi:hypothetical protein